MTSQIAGTSIRSELVVDAPIERAFRVFTEGIGSWFPPEYNMLAVPIEQRIFEPKVGGRIYDKGADGSECHWGNVTAYEPPDRVVFTWHISPQWQIEPDRSKASEVEVRFVAEDATRTRLELEHRELDRHGEGWEQLQQGLADDGGWPGCLRLFAAKAGAEA